VSAVDDIVRSRYVSLVTYRRNGTGVPTPVWHVNMDGELVVITEADTGKVKRIRGNSRVKVTVCDMRGRMAVDAASAEGTARLLDAAQTERARTLLARKYVMSRVGNWFAKILRLRRRPLVGIAVSL
jgi:PPOX class probable F420-dependent enzyme